MIKFLLFAFGLFVFVPFVSAQDVESEAAESSDDENPELAAFSPEVEEGMADSTVVPELWSLLPAVAMPDSNVVHLPQGISPQMALFFSKMDSVLLMGRGRVSILHIGGSHVQADLYTDVFRHRIDSINQGLMPARGFVFPYSAAKTNNPLGYRTKFGGKWQKARCVGKNKVPATLGAGGIAVIAQDASAWFSIDLNRDSSFRWHTTQVHLLGQSTTGGLMPLLDAVNFDGSELTYEPLPEPTGYLFHLSEPCRFFTIRFARVPNLPMGDFVVRGILPMNDDDGITYHTIGVNGAAVPSYLGCARLDDEVRLMAPDLVIMAIGINDATGKNFSHDLFCNNYSALIRRIRDVAPNCAFLFITNNDSYVRVRRRRRKLNPNGVVAQQAFYSLANQWGGGVWDLFQVMGGLGSSDDWLKAGLMQKDHVHFSRLGYKLVGDMFYESFVRLYVDADL